MKLPTFVHLTGTLGDPSAKTDKAILAGITTQGVAGAIGGRTGGLIQGIGGLLTGQPPATNAPSASPGQSPQPINPLDLFLKPKKSR